MHTRLRLRHITAAEEDKLYFFFPLDIPGVSIISSFNTITFHVNKEDSAFNCLLLPSMGHGDVCLNLTDSSLKGICLEIFPPSQWPRENAQKKYNVRHTRNEKISSSHIEKRKKYLITLILIMHFI